MSTPECILVGISGPSSSGKTTLSRHLRDIFSPSTFILHEDDFYKPDADIPTHLTAQIADWDCLGSLNLPALHSALRHIKAHAAAPPDLSSKEDQNEVGKSGVDGKVIDELRSQARNLLQDGNITVAIVDGFLLFSEEMKEIREVFDVKLFLRTDYSTAKRRREARSGYVTIEGFWEDPPGYVENVVWPNYVRDHAFMFERGDVDGTLDEAKCAQLGIAGMPRQLQGDMTGCVTWAYEVLSKALVENKPKK